MYLLPLDEFDAQFAKGIIDIETEEHALGMLDGHVGFSALARGRVGRRQSVVPRVAVAHFRNSSGSSLVALTVIVGSK